MEKPMRKKKRFVIQADGTYNDTLTNHTIEKTGYSWPVEKKIGFGKKTTKVPVWEVYPKGQLTEIFFGTFAECKNFLETKFPG